MLSNDDSRLVEQLVEFNGKSVEELRAFIGTRRRNGIMLDPPGDSKGFVHNGYIIYTTDDRRVNLYIDPPVVSPDGLFDQMELDKCEIVKVEVKQFR